MTSMESTYQGYISSTHDALLVFECVRRGILPKVKRRLREEERKYIRSGQVFVFDERESGIKRWTDGLLWSPSRILWNFLVYRQVDKKFGGRAGLMQDSSEDLNPMGETIIFNNDKGTGRDPSDAYVLGVEPLSAYSAKNFSKVASRESISPIHHHNVGLPRGVNINASAPTLPTWSHDTVDYHETIEVTDRKEAQDERDLVGSLRSSYPFARGGLCKKTISIQIDGSTQHLISYYTVDDVRSGRLRTPSSLPEIASLAISPQLLTKTSFRFPPAIVIGPDGVPRFGEEEGGSKMDELDANDEAIMRRIDRNQISVRAGPMQQIYHPNQDNQYKYNHFEQAQARAQAQAMMAAHSSQQNRTVNRYHDINLPFIHKSPLPHQIGGSGNFEPSFKRLKSSTEKPSEVLHSIDGGRNGSLHQRLHKSSFSTLDRSGSGAQTKNTGEITDGNAETRQQFLQRMLVQQQQINQLPQRHQDQSHDGIPRIIFDTQSMTDWPHSDEAAMMKVALAASAPKPTRNRAGNQGASMEESIEPPPQYMASAPLQSIPQQQQFNWQDDQVYSSRQSVIPSASVSPLPFDAPLAFVPSQRPSTANPRSQQQHPNVSMQQINQMSSVGHWTQQQPNQPSPSGPSYINLPVYDSDNLSPAMRGIPLQGPSKIQGAYHRPVNQAMLVQGHQSHNVD